MVKPFLVIQLRPEDEAADDEYAALLNYGQIDEDRVVRIRAEKKGLGDLQADNYCGIIIGGSPFDVTTPVAEKSAIQLQLEAEFNQLFDQILTQDIPFLGCCSGNGLLGNYLGTPMSRRFAEPVCCRSVTLTEAGKADPLLAGFPDQISVILGHKEACDELPAGAQLLIAGEQCPIQMFRVKNNIYATQFHPEADPDGFALRIRTYQHHGYFEATEAEDLIQDLQRHQTPHAQQILTRFVARYSDR